jgi:hypothetical protein
MNRILAAALLGLGVFATSMPLAAQEAAPAVQATPAQLPVQEPSAAETELARKLMDLTGTRRSFDELLPNLAERAKTTFIRTNPQMQLGIIEVVDRVALEMVEKRADLDKSIARIWAIAFTEDELKALVEFYGSDTGKKFAALQPRILGVEMSQANKWAESVSEQIGRRVREELQIAVEAEAKALTGQAPAAAQPAPAQAPAAPEPAPAQ